MTAPCILVTGATDGLGRYLVRELAGYHLTRRLVPLLAASAPARIVHVASLGQYPIDCDDLMSEHAYDGVRAYRRSKLAQIMFTFDLAAELAVTRPTTPRPVAACVTPALRSWTRRWARGQGAGLTGGEGGAATLVGVRTDTRVRVAAIALSALALVAVLARASGPSWGERPFGDVPAGATELSDSLASPGPAIQPKVVSRRWVPPRATRTAALHVVISTLVLAGMAAMVWRRFQYRAVPLPVTVRTTSGAPRRGPPRSLA